MRSQFGRGETSTNGSVETPRPVRSGGVRLAALAMLGLSLGATGAVLTVSMVQAEDDAGIHAFHQQEAANRRAQQPVRYDAPPRQARAYAPSREGWSLPWFRTQPDGRIAQPPIDLNPFKPRSQARIAQRRRKDVQVATLDTVSGAADVARTICVRLCDGFHAPIGYLRSQSDLSGHEALCQAMNPGVPVKVFKVAAGAATIDGAVARDGKTYGALPMAYGHERGFDAACRPAIAKAGDRRVSLLRDFTLRPGDSVVLEGKVRTFVGGTRWPYALSDFRDFRRSSELTSKQRRQIDDMVGISRAEAQIRGLHRQMRVREANARDDNYATDAVPLRGTLDTQARGPIRMIELSAAAH